jgi:hypothetical protein
MAATPQKRKLSKTPATTTAMISDDTASAALRLISNYCTNSGTSLRSLFFLALG